MTTQVKLSKLACSICMTMTICMALTSCSSSATPKSLAKQIMTEMKVISLQGKYKNDLKPYSMMAKKVTAAQFYAFVRLSKIKRNQAIKDSMSTPAKEFHGKYPALVSGVHAKAFCEYIGKVTGNKVTLPTMKQWIYAGMAGPKQYKYPTNSGTIKPGVNIIAPQQIDNLDTHIPVATYPPNPYGMYGMAGNGVEWAISYSNSMHRHYYMQMGGTLEDIKSDGYSSSEVTNYSYADDPTFQSYTTFRCVLNH